MIHLKQSINAGAFCTNLTACTNLKIISSARSQMCYVEFFVSLRSFVFRYLVIHEQNNFCSLQNNGDIEFSKLVSTLLKQQLSITNLNYTCVIEYFNHQIECSVFQ
ncbi:Hypothetical_protein [Hexamita inflata]|uniref:Hypothetical_protein n=1 Tax=Hexamita inflata TaxID=28002 RepID=A0AA86NPS8_9EUKA|nr:Hypothetical protein HINF_LOCUS10391 [Hexamita inflata]